MRLLASDLTPWPHVQATQQGEPGRAAHSREVANNRVPRISEALRSHAASDRLVGSLGQRAA
jgi:hypothetical protein